MNDNSRVEDNQEQQQHNVTAASTIVIDNQDDIHMRFNNKWKNLPQWLHCMCVVTFDLNLGQALEYVYPPEFRPTEQEISNICYMAFPDSNSGCMGDTKFHMRLRVAPDAKQYESPCEVFKQTYGNYNHECVPVLKADGSHYWGFVYFRQKRDASLPRGYFQKSFILITRLPFFKLYYELLEQLAQLYFDEGTCVLQQACLQIAHEWPKLQAGMSLLLPLYDQLYEVLIPKASSRKTNDSPATQLALDSTNGAQLRTPTKVMTQVHELELFHSLSFILDNLYTLWELVLIAEPIVVVGTSPADCSHMVQSLVALIQPLEYCAEVRPYFTIHDSEFKEFTRETTNTPSVILGVTNPFFVKLLKNWPHMVRLVDQQINYQQQKQLQQNARNAANGNQNGVKQMVNLSNDGSAPGLHSKYRPFLKKDKILIKKVLLGMKTTRPENVQTTLLRRHLLELTQSFMIPLERYMASLMPLQKDISPFKSAPNAHAFKFDDFLATLELSGPQLTSPLKGDWKGLYRRFFDSANFRGWYLARRRELQLTLQDLQLQALTEANMEVWAQDKQEVEIIDMILKLKQKLNLYSNDNGNNTTMTTTTTEEQIRAQIHCMKELLPPDLKNVVNI